MPEVRELLVPYHIRNTAKTGWAWVSCPLEVRINDLIEAIVSNDHDAFRAMEPTGQELAILSEVGIGLNEYGDLMVLFSLAELADLEYRAVEGDFPYCLTDCVRLPEAIARAREGEVSPREIVPLDVLIEIP